MDDLSMITVGPQLSGRGLRLDCTACVGVEWTSYMAGDQIAPARRVLSDLIEVAQRHIREAHGPTCGEARCFVRPGVEHTHPAQGVTVMTDGEPITERAVFTQRDVDPLGRGNAAQLGAGEPGTDGLDSWLHRAREARRVQLEGTCDENTLRSDDAQASDLRKRDENTLRSDQA